MRGAIFLSATPIASSPESAGWFAPCAIDPGDTIVVTNEVGDGVVPAYGSGRLFRDVLGRANHALVTRADRCLPCSLRAAGGTERSFRVTCLARGLIPSHLARL